MSWLRGRDRRGMRGEKRVWLDLYTLEGGYRYALVGVVPFNDFMHCWKGFCIIR